MMLMERQKRTALEPVYRLMKELLPALAISQQNLNYYANLAHYYTIYDLRRMKPEQGCFCPTPRKGKRLSTAPIQLSSRSPVKLCCNNLGHHSAASASRSMLNGVWLNSIVPNKLTCCQATGETPLMMFIAAWSPVPCFCT